jgi:hypothetical protein
MLADDNEDSEAAKDDALTTPQDDSSLLNT